MRVVIASDHGGFNLKKVIIEHLKAKNIDYEDLGTFTEESVDYPDYGQAVGEAVASGKFDRGIIICGTGIGISIAANKVQGVRASLC